MLKQKTLPAITLLLLAALVAVSGLYVVEKARTFTPAHDEVVAATGERRYQWRMVTAWPKNLPALGESAEKLAQLITDASNGRLTVRVYGADEIVPALGVFDAVSSGSVEMGHASAYYWKGKIPAAQFFTSVPFGMNAQEINGWLHYGGGLELWREIYQPYNVIPFAAGNTGIQMAGWFNKEINDVEDLQGLKMRIPGVGGEVFREAGGTAVNIPGGELYTAMQTGIIDAVDWVGPYNDMAFGLHEVAQYYYYPGWQEPGPTLELIINRDAWQQLPADLQHIVSLAARTVNQDMLDLYTTRNALALQQLRANDEIEVRPLPDAVLDELRAAAGRVYASTAAKDATFARVYQAYREYHDQAKAYHRISEQAYYQLGQPPVKLIVPDNSPSSD